MLYIKTVPEYVNFFEKLLTISPQDDFVKDILELLRNLEAGCKCQRGNRYRFAKEKILNYLANINQDSLSQLKTIFNTNDFKFEELVMY